MGGDTKVEEVAATSAVQLKRTVPTERATAPAPEKKRLCWQGYRKL